MTFADPVVSGLLGLAVASVLACLAYAHLSPEARERKRRRRSYGRVTTRVHRPAVRFSVRAR